MQFDPRRRVYVRPDGSVVSPAELRQQIENYITEEKREVDAKAQELIAGTITAAVFFEYLRDKIKEVHGAAGMVAYGGEDQMNTERWTRIGEKVSSETAYVSGFEADFLNSEKAAERITEVAVAAIESASGRTLPGHSLSAIEDLVRTTTPSEIPVAAESLNLPVEAETVKAAFTEAANAERVSRLIFGETPGRAQMYMESVYATHENSVRDREADAGVISGRRVCEEDGASCDECVAAASEDFMPLDEITDIGSLTCMSNCRCEIVFDYSGIGPLTIDRSIYAPGFA